MSHIIKSIVTESTPPQRISLISFSVLSSSDIIRLSHLQINSGDFYDPSKRIPVAYGPLDRRLGISDKSSICETCNKNVADCVGHFGHLKLYLPVFHIGYIREIVIALQMICKECSRVLLSDEEREMYTRRMRAIKNDRLKRAGLLKIIHEKCKKKAVCSRCNAINGTVKKLTGIFRIIHDKFKAKATVRAKETFMSTFDTACNYNPDLATHLHKVVQDLNPLVVHSLFQNIPNCDLDVLDMPNGRPEDLIIAHILIPPVCIRPSVPMGSSGSNEDDLTVKLGDIARINTMIKNAIEKNGQTTTLMELWDFLQQQCAMYINSDMPGFPPSAKNTGGKPVRALAQRLKGKQGRFRGNLSGKRVDFSARTVISPDPNLSIEEVGVPVLVAKILTVPERVTVYNIDLMRKLIRNGPAVHPGANFVEMPDGTKKFLKYTNRHQLAKDLMVGTLIERHLMDGDVVLFNRQPSLHRLSIMCHRVCVRPWRTFRFNTCVCTPYNADFDGDEMNLHVPQTLEARAEALTLMSVKENLVTPKNGEVLVSLNQDFVTGSYLLSQKDVFFDRAQFSLICSYIGDGSEQVDIPPPAIWKPVQLWTGKQIFSVIWKPNNRQKWPLINFEMKARNYEKDDIMCPRDGYIIVRSSEVMCGNLCKSATAGAKNGIFYVLIRDHSTAAAARMMNRNVKIISRWLKDWGFSFGINDVMPSKKLEKLKESLVDEGYKVCNEYIGKFNAGKLEAKSGCTEEETLEATLLGQLSNIRGDAGTACLNELPYLTNSPLIMAVCGSKGSKINISQMIACVGQQAVNGHRIPNGFGDRSLPHFDHGSRTPAAKGFVQNSFYTGLTATEFFFHTMGGREGLVDTAVKTAETGYMQRRLMKALEDLTASYDLTVRNSENTVVQFTYGDDGLDPIVMEVSGPADFSRILDNIRSHSPFDNETALLSHEIRAMTTKLAEDPVLKTFSITYLGSVFGFLNDIASKIEKAIFFFQDSMTENDICARLFRLTPSQFKLFVSSCSSKYLKAMIEPGTAVGAIGGQSIGEPGTQMTLKTFHFAGVASMNVTLGVPRIKEIINAAKNISTPIITAHLECDNDIKAARIVKARIEKTCLGEVCNYIYEVYNAEQCYINIKINFDIIQDLNLEVSIESIRQAILNSKLKLKEKNVMIKGNDEIRVYPYELKREKMLPLIQNLKQALPFVVVKGLKTVARAVISDISKGTTKYQLLVEGADLRGVMGITGVRGIETTCNHVMEVEKRLGVEAARLTIVKEIQTTMEGHGLSVDFRHLMLLADVMTFQGEVLGITRFGISKMKQSVLMLASFEKTVDHLFAAAVHNLTDTIVGVSESIIMGVPMPVGTNLFKLVQKTEKVPLPSKRPLLLTGKYKHNLKL